MSITFRYKTVKRPDGSLIKTPSIPVLLKEKEVVDTLALLDSGADISAIPKNFADTLGLDLSGEKSPEFGIGGTVDAIDTTMSINVSKGHENYNFRIPVKVILGQYDFPMLLGRAGFFDRFRITFDQDQEKISLKKVTE